MKRIVLVAIWILGGCAPTRAPLENLDAAIQRNEFPRTTSVVVVREGKTIYEHYWNGTSVDTQHDTRSATKSITSLGIGIAVARGKIPSVDAPAFPFLVDLGPFGGDGPLKQQITIADFLTMSSALDCNDDVEDSPGNEENMYPKQVWARWAADIPLKAGYARDATGRGPFSYCTAGVFLLGQILSRAVGRKIDDWLDDELFTPMGITQGEWSKSPSGEIMTGGGLRLRSRDLVKLGQMVLDGGKWEGKQIVPAAFIARALTIHRQMNREQHYGYLFWHREYATACGRSSGWYMSGNGGNAIVMVPDLRAVIVVTRVNYNTKGMHQQTIQLLEKYAFPSLPCAR